MPNRKPFPATESELDIYFNKAVPYLSGNSDRLNIDAEAINAIGQNLHAWNSQFTITQNVAIRTTTSVMQKNVTKKELIQNLRSIYADIARSKLTDQDRNTLDIGDRNKPKTPVAVPDTKPVVTVSTVNRLEHIIKYTDENGSKSKPKGVRGAQIWYKTGSPAENFSELTYLETETASPAHHQFDVKDAGKPVYYWLRWENTRGKTGPWSDTVMATITG